MLYLCKRYGCPTPGTLKGKQVRILYSTRCCKSVVTKNNE